MSGLEGAQPEGLTLGSRHLASVVFLVCVRLGNGHHGGLGQVVKST